MSDRSRQRRRRSGSTSARFTPSQLVTIEASRQPPVGASEIAACGAVFVVALALTALIWIVTSRTVQDQRNEIRDRAEQALVAQAATMAETVGMNC